MPVLAGLGMRRPPLWAGYFTPTSSSWLNLVERFFADLTGDVIRAGSFASVNQLIRDVKLGVPPLALPQMRCARWLDGSRCYAVGSDYAALAGVATSIRARTAGERSRASPTGGGSAPAQRQIEGAGERGGSSSADSPRGGRC